MRSKVTNGSEKVTVRDLGGCVVDWHAPLLIRSRNPTPLTFDTGRLLAISFLSRLPEMIFSPEGRGVSLVGGVLLYCFPLNIPMPNRCVATLLQLAIYCPMLEWILDVYNQPWDQLIAGFHDVFLYSRLLYGILTVSCASFYFANGPSTYLWFFHFCPEVYSWL